MRENESDVVVSIEIAAPPEIVHSFFADPVRFAQWLGHDATLTADGFRIPNPGGGAAVGKIDASDPVHITMTYGYEQSEHGLAPGATRVDVHLRKTARGTSLRLIHSGLATAEQRRNHLMGWRFYAGALANAASSVFASDRAEPTVNAYLAAWAAQNAEERRSILEQCWAHDGVFKDAMGYAEGREALDAYIANAQRFMPGVSLRRKSPVTRSHGHVLFEWEIAIPDGTVIATGWNVGELDADAQFTSMIGFAS